MKSERTPSGGIVKVSIEDITKLPRRKEGEQFSRWVEKDRTYLRAFTMGENVYAQWRVSTIRRTPDGFEVWDSYEDNLVCDIREAGNLFEAFNALVMLQLSLETFTKNKIMEAK